MRVTPYQPALFAALWAAASTAAVPPELFATEVYTKLLTTAQSSSSPQAWPEYTNVDGSWASFDATTWTSAFFSSTLYALHHRHSVLCPASTPSAANGSTTDWLSLARTWSAGLYTPDEALTNTHDVGFLSWPAQAELRLDPSNATAHAAVLQEAEHLADRFSTVVGCTKSWDNGGTDDFEVIIDNMVNLELLVLASTLTGNSTFLNMAMSHSNKTIANHVRPDFTTYHVVDYNPSSGGVVWRGTAQGYSNSSTWSRGQSWGVYGFAQMYNATEDQQYLDTARGLAQWYLQHLPPLGVPYWDFDAPLPATLDTSSSLIMSSALLQLASIEATHKNSSGVSYWSNSAVTLLNNVVAQAVTGWSGSSLVGNGTVNNRGNPPINDTGIIYGDNMFIEAGNRLLQLGLANCSDGSPAVGASLTSLASGTSGSAASSSDTASAPGATTSSKTSSGSRLAAIRFSCSRGCLGWLLAWLAFTLILE